MDDTKVSDILVTPLSRIEVQGGDVMHGMRIHDPGYVGFGEAYFSFIHHKSIKAWKKHLKMTLNLCVPIGNVRFIFIDEFGGVREEVIGNGRYVRLTVPPSIWFGFEGMAEHGSLLLNVADIIHDPEEIERKKLFEIKSRWLEVA